MERAEIGKRGLNARPDGRVPQLRTNPGRLEGTGGFLPRVPDGWIVETAGHDLTMIKKRGSGRVERRAWSETRWGHSGLFFR
jgi:hypothetical protein